MKAPQKIFKEFAKASEGQATEAVLEAAFNLVVNAVRQNNPNWKGGEEQYNFWSGKFKEILHSHYDSVTGRRRTVFGLDQIVEMDHFDARDKFN